MKIDFQILANPHIRGAKPYQTGKPIEELARELGISEIIKLASNENPLGASPKAIVAATKALQHSHCYPDSNYYDLKLALAKFLTIDSKQITIGNGSESLLELIIRTFLHPEEVALVSQYAFIAISLLITRYGAIVRLIPARNYAHDVHAMLAAIDKQTKMLFLVNPNNPTGTYINDHDFKKILACVPSNVLIIVDEAYSEYISKPDYPDTLAYIKKFPNLIVTRTFSKVYGLAALRMGYAISSCDIAELLNRARLPFNVNSIAAKAAIAAIEDQDHVIKSVLLNQAGMRQIETALTQQHLAYIPSIGNFISIDVGKADYVYQQLLKKGVIVRPLFPYNMPKHLRVTIGTEAQNEYFLQALLKIISSYQYQDQMAIAQPS